MDDSDDEPNENVGRKKQKVDGGKSDASGRKRGAVKSAVTETNASGATTNSRKKSSVGGCASSAIDLTNDDDDDEEKKEDAKQPPVNRTKSCGRCTFLNTASAEVCEMCMAHV